MGFIYIGSCITWLNQCVYQFSCSKANSSNNLVFKWAVSAVWPFFMFLTLKHGNSSNHGNRTFNFGSDSHDSFWPEFWQIFHNLNVKFFFSFFMHCLIFGSSKQKYNETRATATLKFILRFIDTHFTRYFLHIFYPSLFSLQLTVNMTWVCKLEPSRTTLSELVLLTMKPAWGHRMEGTCSFTMVMAMALM